MARRATPTARSGSASDGSRPGCWGWGCRPGRTSRSWPTTRTATTRRTSRAHYAGMPLAPLNIRLAAEELAFILRDGDIRALLVGPEYLPLLSQFRDAVPVLTHVIVLDAAAPARRPHLRVADRGQRARRSGRPRLGRGRPHQPVLHGRHDGPAQGRDADAAQRRLQRGARPDDVRLPRGRRLAARRAALPPRRRLGLLRRDDGGRDAGLRAGIHARRLPWTRCRRRA